MWRNPVFFSSTENFIWSKMENSNSDENTAVDNISSISVDIASVQILDTSLKSSNDEQSSALPKQDKVPFWTGILEWFGGPNDDVKSQSLPCTFYSQAVDDSSDVSLTEWGQNQGQKAYLHLLPRSELKKLNLEYLQNTRNYNLSLDNSPGRMALTKLLRTGRYAGCIHSSTTGEGVSRKLTEEMQVIILLYSRGKQAIIGFVPNEMPKFVSKLLEVVPDHEIHEVVKKEETKVEGTVVDNLPNEIISQETEQMETEEVQDPVQNYWNYEISSDFKQESPLAISSLKERDTVESVNKKLNFFKGCKWAPDGSCIMSNSDDDIIRIFNVPETIYGVSDWNTHKTEEGIEVMESVLKVKEGGQVYDYCWYPLMSSYDPVSSCFLTTCSDSPTHLWDAFTGKLRASYLAYDHLDQVVAARSVAFDPSGQFIHCGFDTMIRTFDITRPGRHCTERKLKTSNFSQLNQPGIVSCMTTNPMLKSVMAVGSYLKTVGLYHDDGSVLCILQGHIGGVTHLKFSHDGTKLYSGGRKDSRLICWDMRYMGDKYTIYDRIVSTNQRIYFDITPNDKYLITGGTDGQIKIWETAKDSTEPLSTFQTNLDCVNGVSINPFIPLLATSSGQRHAKKVVPFPDESDSSDLSDSESQILANIQKEEQDIKLWKFC